MVPLSGTINMFSGNRFHLKDLDEFFQMVPVSGIIGMFSDGLLNEGFAGLNPCKHHDIFNAAILKGSQKRWASQAASASRKVKAEDDSKISIGPHHDEDDEGVVYHGPISATIKKVKLLSLSTCCLSVSLGPVITFLTAPEMNVILKGAVASTVIFLSASTTGALHWFVSPYIHKLKWKPGSDTFDVEMLSWLATHIPKTIRFADIRPPETNRPFVTFKADGNFYFVDEEHCKNKALLAKLTPSNKSTQESVFKNV